MTLIIAIIISEFTNNDDFMNSFSLLCSCDLFKKRTRQINKARCSKLLYLKLNKLFHMQYVDYEIRFINELLLCEEMNYNELINEVSDILLGNNIYYKKGIMFNRKTIVYTKNTSSNVKIRNVPCCFIYRVPYSKRKYILNNTPYAKALIY